MKQLLVICLIVIMSTTTIEAQNPQYPLGISFKSLFMDYQSQNGGSITDFSAYHYGFEIGLHKNINQNLNLVLPIKAGVVNQYNAANNDNCLHKNVYGADIQAQYQFYRPDTKVTPYVLAGLGGVNESEGEFNLQIPFGVGLHFHIRDNAYFNWQSEYRYALSENRNNLHHGIGFVYLFGVPQATDLIPMEEKDEMMDSDGDGLEDEIDLCPQIAGPAALKGCPDKDEDGIPDYRDDCPSVAGIGIFKGCPDTDGDGISDNDDECPNKAGVKENNGCPAEDMMDTDMDGIPDKLDECPNIKGVSPNGCPKKPVVADSDGDGVPDSSDKCPNSPGIAAFGGCPDSDGDGVTDKIDICPNIKQGKFGIDGCPDTDKDGTVDSKDNCPKTPEGINGRQGCPDSDGDGLLDVNDGCPKEYGPKSNNGCKKESPTPVVQYLNSDKDVKYVLDQIDNDLRDKASFINSSHPYKTRLKTLRNKASRIKTTQKLSFLNECKSLRADIESARAPVPKPIPKVAEKVTQEMAESRMKGKPSRLNLYSECPGVSSNGPFAAQLSVKPSRYLNLVSMVVYSASDSEWKASIQLLEDNKQVGIITDEDILDGETTISLTEFGYILVPGKTYKLEITGGGKLRNLNSCNKRQSSDDSINIDQSSIQFISKLNYNY